MKPRLCICKECKQERYLYAKKLCQRCYWASKPKKPLPKPKKQIRKFSKKSLDQLKRYRILRDKYLEENPICQYPGCKNREVTLHHKKGRQGAYLTDKRFFCALCWPHHQFIEQNPQIAYKMGLSIKRLEK